MKLIIEDDEGRESTFSLASGDGEVTVGRLEDNTLCLRGRNISRRHARFQLQSGSWFIEDLDSANGVFVNGERIAGPTLLQDGDIIQLGDYHLTVEDDRGASARGSRGQRESGGLLGTIPAPPDDDRTPPYQMAVSAPSAGSQAEPAQRSLPLRGLGPAVEAIPADQAPRLVLLGPGGREYPCTRTELRVGSAADNDIVLEHKSVAAHHCRLVRVAPGEWKLIGTPPGEGIKVNGEPYAETVIHPGDELELGELRLHFLAAGEDAALGPEEAPLPWRTKLAAIAVAAVVLAMGLAGYFVLGRGEHGSAPAPAPAAAESAPASLGTLPDGNRATASLASGRALAEDPRDRCADAVVALRQALEADPAVVEAHYYLGRCYARLGEASRAVYHYEQFVHERPSDPRTPPLRQLLREHFEQTGETPRWPLED